MTNTINMTNNINIMDNFPILLPNNKFNIIIQCLIILGFIFYTFKKKIWSYICFVLIILIIYREHLYNDIIDVEKVNYKTCRHSTIDNPMSNLLPYSIDPNNKACLEDENIKTDNLFFNYFRNQNDHINREKMKNFITMPVTNIEGERKDFLDFIYNGYDGEYKSCKYDGIDCEKYRDLRFMF